MHAPGARDTFDDRPAATTSLSPVTEPAQPGADQGSWTVVVAEDEVLIRMDLVEMLTEEGYDVVGAGR